MSVRPMQTPTKAVDKTPVNPMALSVEELAKLLSATGGKRVTEEQIQSDIAAGAPVGQGGKVNLIHYAAWLLREAQTR